MSKWHKKSWKVSYFFICYPLVKMTLTTDTYCSPTPHSLYAFADLLLFIELIVIYILYLGHVRTAVIIATESTICPWILLAMSFNEIFNCCNIFHMSISHLKNYYACIKTFSVSYKYIHLLHTNKNFFSHIILFNPSKTLWGAQGKCLKMTNWGSEE